MFVNSSVLYQSVLLIDDNKSDNLINRSVILKNKFAANVSLCNSGAEGIQYLLRQFKDHRRSPEMIFLDIKMPGIDGFEFLKLFEDLDTSIKQGTSIIMLSSSTDLGDYFKAIRNPYVLSYLRKPLNIVELISLAA